MRLRPSRVSLARLVTSPTWPRAISALRRSSSRRFALVVPLAERKAVRLAVSMSAPTRSRISASRSTTLSKMPIITWSGERSRLGGCLRQRVENMAMALGVA